MTIKELENHVRVLELCGRFDSKLIGPGTYRVNPCPICGGKDHFTIYPETNSYSSFSHCCTGGSVYKFLQEVEGMNGDEALQELQRLAGETPAKGGTTSEAAANTRKEGDTRPTKDTQTPNNQQDYTNWINKLYQKMTQEERKCYHARGISDETIDRFELCTDDGRMILPIWENGKVVGYTGRAIDPNTNPKYKNNPGTAHLFNSEHIKNAQSGDVVIVTEGIFDALSIEQAGCKAVALGGVQHANKLIDLSKNAKGVEIIIAFDNDDPGRSGATDLMNKLGENIASRSIKIPDDLKDVNEWAIKDPEGFEKGIRTQVLTPDAVSHYLGKSFLNDIRKNQVAKQRTTGFANLDKELKGVYPGLYIVGGISSVGKTTFVYQLADQLVTAGEHVIYYTLEQGRIDLISKTLARMTAQKDKKTAVNGLSIRNGELPKNVIDALEEYELNANRMSIIEGNFSTTAAAMREYVEGYATRNKVKPIVIIDYLQIIPASDSKVSDKQKIDQTVTSLKQMSRDLDITVIVISSLNRGNYLSPIDFEAFKESGGIEYTADVILGLQLEVINEGTFDNTGKLKEKREKIRKAKNETPREIELVCLKNRNGKANFSVYYQYYPQYDLFEESRSAKESETRI